jgi:hypothetical protein
MTTNTSCLPSLVTSAWRDQFRMTHTFHLSLGANEPIASQVESTLTTSNARIEKWVISRRGGFYDHCITVEGIGDDSARELRKEFARLNGDIKVHVEHMLHFDSKALSR